MPLIKSESVQYNNQNGTVKRIVELLPMEDARPDAPPPPFSDILKWDSETLPVRNPYTGEESEVAFADIKAAYSETDYKRVFVQVRWDFIPDSA